MSDWIAFLPLLAMQLGVVFLPGYLCGRLLGLAAPLAWAAAPAWALGAAGIGALVAAGLGVEWGPVSLAVALLVAVGAAWGLGWKLRPVAPALAGPRWPAATWAALVAGSLAIGLPTLLVARPGQPAQGWDTPFHLNALWLVKQTGNASAFGGLTPLYGEGTPPVTVLTGWHALLAPLSPADQLVPAVTLHGLVVASAWLLGLAALGSVLGGPRLGHAVALLAPLASFFPTYPLALYPVYPHIFAHALLPGLLAVSGQALRAARATAPLTARRRRWVGLARAGAVGGLWLGVSTAHLLPLASAALLSLPAAGWAWARRLHTAWRRQHHVTCAAWALAPALAGVALWGAGRLSPGLAAHLARLTPAPHQNPGSLGSAAWRTLLGWPPLPPAVTWVAGWLAVVQGMLLVLAAVGLVATARGAGRGRVWLLGAAATAAALLATTWSRSGPLLGLAGLWYTSPSRALMVAQLPLVLLAGRGAQALRRRSAGRRAGRPRERRPRWEGRGKVAGMAALAFVVGGLAAPPRLHYATAAYTPGSGHDTQVLAPGELEMLARLRSALPPGALVFGDPLVGTAYLPALSGQATVFPQFPIRDSRTAEHYLLAHLAEAATDPLVCQTVRRLGVTHLYFDPDTAWRGDHRDGQYPGVRTLPAIPLTEVERGGTARLSDSTAAGRARRAARASDGMMET